MKKVLTSVLAIMAMASVLNAGDKYAGLSADYLNNGATVHVKRIMASDPQTDHGTLEILFHDKDLKVRGNVVANPSF